MIGIVGGVGPFAGLDVFKKIIEETVASTDQQHLPVMLMSYPNLIADRTKYLLGESLINPAEALADIIMLQEAAGATVTGIPCNTAHAFPIIAVVQERLKAANATIKLVHLIEETVNFIAANYEQPKVAVLSTTGTAKTGLYTQHLEAVGLEVVAVSPLLQEQVHACIYNEEYGIKAFSSPVTNRAKNELNEVMDALKKEGATVIVLGCTELPLALPQPDYNGMPLIDPNRIMARALIQHYNPEKLKDLAV
ncbi:aspartate/glutamate racemase family protein [Sphingobacteriaceae bacterium WQ 2009]|uniref:Aspartate/glutamate racemase family protein n=1 Tax=Rhinopithecimicrobium faecis TaxID=2820698 RepID=A0A8T4HBR2_9SPHI|nr:aspartate/glutamate racemase family protein [Sphingobacteriaceae bacterium WQ 2009]